MASVISSPTRAKPPAISQTHLLIDGKWVLPTDGGTLDTVNPATGATIATVFTAGKNDVDLAVKAARRALESGPWSRMDAADRGVLLFKLADLVESTAKNWQRSNLSTAEKPLSIAVAI